MSWSPPGDCDTRAKTLETKSNLFGQALNYNVKKDRRGKARADPGTGAARAQGRAVDGAGGLRRRRPW
jgi:hypothetical protein